MGRLWIGLLAVWKLVFHVQGIALKFWKLKIDFEKNSSVLLASPLYVIT
jgi:hypothetical protein